jgi:hypothetical protein
MPKDDALLNKASVEHVEPRYGAVEHHIGGIQSNRSKMEQADTAIESKCITVQGNVLTKIQQYSNRKVRKSTNQNQE